MRFDIRGQILGTEHLIHMSENGKEHGSMKQESIKANRRTRRFDALMPMLLAQRGTYLRTGTTHLASA
jgi:hypothetical protein